MTSEDLDRLPDEVTDVAGIARRGGRLADDGTQVPRVGKQAWHRPADPVTVGVATAAGVVALVVRWPPALGNALWQDEVASARILVLPGISALRRVAGTESTPPAWYALSWLTHHLGVPVADVRMISVICGALLSGLVVVYAARFVPLSAAALAGTLTALGWQFVLHGAELRAYALLALVSLVFVLVLEVTADAATPARLGLLASSVALGSLTHYFFLLTLVSGLLWVWLSPELQSHRSRLTLACSIGMIPLAVWSPAALVQYRHGAFAWIGPFDARAVAEVVARLFVREPSSVVPGPVLALVLLGLVLLGALRLWRRSLGGRLCALAAVVPIVMAALAWLGGASVFTTRNLLGAGPFLAVALASAVASLPRRAVPVVAAAAMLLALASYAHSDRPPPRFDRIAQTLVADGWQPHDPIALLTPVFTYLDPVGWYLPAHEELTLVAPRPGVACTSVYVVSLRGAVPGADTHERVGRVLVARVPWTPSIWDDLRRRGGVVIASRRTMPACVSAP